MKGLYTLFLIIITLLCTSGQMLSAGTWIENFNGDNLDSWKIPEDRVGVSTWQVKNGYLDYNFSHPQGKLFMLYTSVFLFNGFPLNVDSFRVKLAILDTHNSMVGIVLGKYTNINNWINYWRSSYKFFQRSVWPPIDFPGQQPDMRLDIDKDIEIFFDKGHFELMSNRKHILEFDDPNLQTIDCLGIIAYVDQKRLASFQVDDFVIFGPNILDVRPQDKAAVLWGELKRQ